MGTLERLPGITGRKVGMTSNHHAPYDLGYTRATMAVTKGSEPVRESKPQKGCLSSDCSLQLDYMKLESLGSRIGRCGWITSFLRKKSRRTKKHCLIIRVQREYPHRVPDRHKEESLLSEKWMEGRMYGTNVPDIEMKRSEIEI